MRREYASRRARDDARGVAGRRLPVTSLARESPVDRTTAIVSTELALRPARIPEERTWCRTTVGPGNAEPPERIRDCRTRWVGAVTSALRVEAGLARDSAPPALRPVRRRTGHRPSSTARVLFGDGPATRLVRILGRADHDGRAVFGGSRCSVLAPDVRVAGTAAGWNGRGARWIAVRVSVLRDVRDAAAGTEQRRDYEHARDSRRMSVKGHHRSFLMPSGSSAFTVTHGARSTPSEKRARRARTVRAPCPVAARAEKRSVDRRTAAAAALGAFLRTRVPQEGTRGGTTDRPGNAVPGRLHRRAARGIHPLAALTSALGVGAHFVGVRAARSLGVGEGLRAARAMGAALVLRRDGPGETPLTGVGTRGEPRAVRLVSGAGIRAIDGFVARHAVQRERSRARRVSSGRRGARRALAAAAVPADG